MRKGIDGLVMLAQHVLQENPFDGALFAFRGRRGGMVKLLWYDGQVSVARPPHGSAIPTGDIAYAVSVICPICGPSQFHGSSVSS